MYPHTAFFRGSVRRGLIGLLLVAAHAGAIVLFALGMLAAPPRQGLPPLTVDFVEQPTRAEPAPRLADPKLVAVTMTVPEAVVPTDLDVPAETPAVVAPTPPTTLHGAGSLYSLNT